jgi:3-oxoacyl-[acyl-carrier-protein] synthase II
MRLFLTGIGVVTPLGIGTEVTWSRLVRGERGIGPLGLFTTEGYRGRLGAEVHGLPNEMPSRAAWSRTALMAYLAAREAIVSARLGTGQAERSGRLDGKRVGLVVGGTTGGMLENEELLARAYDEPSRHDELRGLLSHPLWATADRLGEMLGPFARVRTLSSACSSGANALVVAAAWILSGAVDTVVAGGTDGLCRLTFSGFNALAAIDPEPCRPFDSRRRGLNLGEGAGFVVIERDDVARARGAAPVAELAGWALGAEAHHITNPEPSGSTAASVMTRALARAGLTPRDVDYVNAHGTGTPLNDPMESAAIVRALGRDEVARVRVSSSKGQIGHTLAAAGAIETAITALVIGRQTLVPTAGLEEIDPACAALSHVRGEGERARVRAAITNAFGFGGMDSALVLSEPELGPEHAPARRSVVVTAAASFTAHGLLGTRESAALLAAASSSPALPPLEPFLDLDRARRLDRPARLGAIVVERALADADKGAVDRPPAGVILGSTFGSIDASAAYMHRIFDKGPRFASPADFPNLVPSSPVGHVSIYLGLHGPVFAAAELGASGECAVLQAAELIAAGEGDVIVAGDMEELNGVVDRALTTLFARGDGTHAGRCEGGAAVVLEAEDAVRARGAAPIARLAAFTSWHGGEASFTLPAPNDVAAARVVLAFPAPGLDALLGPAGWGSVARALCPPSADGREMSGAVPLAAAVSLLARGEIREALLVGLAKGRGYAMLFVAP